MFDFNPIAHLLSNIDEYIINLYMKILQLWNEYYCDVDSKFDKVYFFDLSIFNLLDISYKESISHSNFDELKKINFLELFQSNSYVVIPIYLKINTKSSSFYIARLSVKEKTVQIYDAKGLLKTNSNLGK